MLHVGLTGNIASGKSYVSQVFADLGAHVIDADTIAHELMQPGTTTYEKVVQAFGPAILDGDGSIDRKALGCIVFSDSAKREALNRLVHPAVREQIVQRISELEHDTARGIVIVDAALMVETGSYRLYDRLVVVSCDPALQLLRLMNRDGLSEQEARARMATQMPAAEKAKLAHYVIDTSATFRKTREQVEAAYHRLVMEEINLTRHPEA